jgi:lipopolysaccharide export LptBFGC system permease protein LptF
MAHIFEALMVISFGISWPTSIMKSYSSRTAKGKSIIFLIFILIGYIFGVVSKFIAGDITYVVIFYIINFIMVSVDLCLYFRNRKLDAEKETQQRRSL